LVFLKSCKKSEADMKRRKFIRNAAFAATLLGTSPLLSCNGTRGGLNILVLGGTDFLGPAIVHAGIRDGHRITLFNRGITNPALFAELPQIRGDRETGSAAYAPLKEQHWDVVIDVWPQRSVLVDQATAALQHHTGHYVFISSVAVYKDFAETGRNEDYDLVPLPNDRSSWEYPEEKAAAEALVADRFPEHHTILRPGPIKGWRDPALDLLYWLIKIDRNESILAPGTGRDALQFIDVKDVGSFAITAVEKQLVGAYNCVGPTKGTLDWRTFLESAKEHLASGSEIVWSSQDQLREQQVYPWSGLPLWAPTSDDYFMEISNAKALAAGFTYSPIEKTIGDCLAWHNKQGDPNLLFGKGAEPVGLERTRELEVIANLQRS